MFERTIKKTEDHLLLIEQLRMVDFTGPHMIGKHLFIPNLKQYCETLIELLDCSSCQRDYDSMISITRRIINQKQIR
jgi:hypothetical protein